MNIFSNVFYVTYHFAFILYFIDCNGCFQCSLKDYPKEKPFSRKEQKWFVLFSPVGMLGQKSNAWVTNVAQV